MNLVIEKIKKYYGIIIVCLFLLISCIFVLIKQENIYFQIHDNMDSNISWFKMMKDGHYWWSFNTEIPFLGGVDRDSLYSDLKVYSWIHMIFPTFSACIIGWIINIIISVIGFIVLGKIVFDEGDINIFSLCGLMYGILPVFPSSGTAFASLPLIIALLVLQEKDFKYSRFVLLLIYPVLSDFSLFGIFIIGFLVIGAIVLSFAYKKIQWKLLISGVPVIIGYVATEWRLFNQMLFSNEESIRSTFVKNYASLRDAIKTAGDVFLFGHYHSGSQHTVFVLPVCIIFWIVQNCIFIKNKEYKKCFTDIFNILMLWQMFNCLVYGLCTTKLLENLVETVLPQLEGFNFSRTLWFSPFVWYFSLLVILIRLKKFAKTYLRYASVVLVLLCLLEVMLFPATYNCIGFNAFKNSDNYISQWILQKYYAKGGFCTFDDFYSEELMEVVKSGIDYDKDKDWAIAYGMHPAVLEYNGIKTLDGYLSYYPLEYKKQFRNIIAPYLELDAESRAYYDNWGGRAYVFGSGVSNVPGVNNNIEANIYIDSKAFKDMGGRFVISSVKINNYLECGLIFRGKYTDKDSPYIIYVYDVR